MDIHQLSTSDALGSVFESSNGATRAGYWSGVVLSLGIIIALVPEGLLPTLTLSLVLAGDPMDMALAEMSERLTILPVPPPRLDEWPFDSERMRQSVVYPQAGGPAPPGRRTHKSRR